MSWGPPADLSTQHVHMLQETPQADHKLVIAGIGRGAMIIDMRKILSE